VTVSRWDLLHLLYSVEHPPRCDRDRRDLAGVMGRCMGALDRLPSAAPMVVTGGD
jgi:hypothetical protein